MRPIFNPSARVNVACPSRVGRGDEAGVTRSGFLLLLLPILAVLNLLFGCGIVSEASALSRFADFPESKAGPFDRSAVISTAVADSLPAPSCACSFDFAVCIACALAYKSITSRLGLLSREAL